MPPHRRRLAAVLPLLFAFAAPPARAAAIAVGPPGGAVWSLAVASDGTGTVYAETGDGIFRSADSGESWSRLPLPHGYRFTVTVNPRMGEGVTSVVAALDPSSPATLYAGIMRVAGRFEVGELFRSRNGGASWQRLRFTERVLAVAVDPLRPARVYAGLAGRGVLRSTDGGANWRVAAQGPRAAYVDAVAVDPFTPGKLLVAATAAFERGLGLFESRDRGRTWTRLFSEALRRATYRVHDIAFDPARPDEVYIASYAGVFRSVDGGATWEPANAGMEGHVIALVVVDPALPGSLFAAGWRNEPCSEGLCREHALFHSDDGAATWARLPAPLPAAPIRELAFDVGELETVHALVAGRLYTSRDGGVTWGQPSPGPGDRLADLAGDPDRLGVLYAVRSAFRDSAFLVSPDGGRTWSEPTEDFRDSDLTAVAPGPSPAATSSSRLSATPMPARTRGPPGASSAECRFRCASWSSIPAGRATSTP